MLATTKVGTTMCDKCRRLADTLDQPVGPQFERRVLGVLVLHAVLPSVLHRRPARVLVVVHLEADEGVRVRREQLHGLPAVWKEKR